jgi:centromeric protein E
VKVTPLAEHKLKKPEDIQLVLLRGDAARMTAATEFNNVSSRSHAVMRIQIEARDASRRVRTSVLVNLTFSALIAEYDRFGGK